MGHEAFDFVTCQGDAVSNFRVGDRVVISDTVHSVQAVTEPSTSFAFGMGPGQGDLGGCQSEYVRVPFAEQTLMQTSIPSDNDIDYLFLSDIFATGWGALDFSGFEPGDTVAVFGAGPVGFLSAYSALLRGASKYVVDPVPERLELVRSIGAVPVNFFTSDPVEQILAQEPNGVVRSVDCVGFEAVNQSLQMDSDLIIRQMVDVTARNGGIEGVGIYADVHNSTGAPRGSSVMNDISFPVGTFFSKGLQYKVSAVYPPDYATALLPLINSDLSTPRFLISSLVSIEDAAHTYARFNARQETKVLIRFQWS